LSDAGGDTQTTSPMENLDKYFKNKYNRKVLNKINIQKDIMLLIVTFNHVCLVFLSSHAAFSPNISHGFDKISV